MTPVILQDDPSVKSFFTVEQTETLMLFEHLSFEFLEKFDVFASAEMGQTRGYKPPEAMRGFLHCFSKGIYGIRPVARELNNTLVWFSCGFDRLPSRDGAIASSPTSDRSLMRYSSPRRAGSPPRPAQLNVLE